MIDPADHLKEIMWPVEKQMRCGYSILPKRKYKTIWTYNSQNAHPVLAYGVLSNLLYGLKTTHRLPDIFWFLVVRD